MLDGRTGSCVNKVGSIFPNAIRKQTYITCKAITSLGQSQKTHKLHLGGGLLVLKNGAMLLDGKTGSRVGYLVNSIHTLGSPCPTLN
jgi:hypothetical protein